MFGAERPPDLDAATPAAKPAQPPRPCPLPKPTAWLWPSWPALQVKWVRPWGVVTAPGKEHEECRCTARGTPAQSPPHSLNIPPYPPSLHPCPALECPSDLAPPVPVTAETPAWEIQVTLEDTTLCLTGLAAMQQGGEQEQGTKHTATAVGPNHFGRSRAAGQGWGMLGLGRPSPKWCRLHRNSASLPLGMGKGALRRPTATRGVSLTQSASPPGCRS